MVKWLGSSLLKQIFAKELEDHKAELAKELENHKVELGIGATRQKILFERLHLDRVEIITSLY